MAGVFLSYARHDTAKARLLAAALEKAGHSVWWDLHVRGGTQFSKVIEEALKAADVVVVLWSVQSVESPWVRDEAATGRDRGRLVPVALDKTEPPLGFRQFQTIDLGAWKGRGAVPRLPEILHSIDGVLGEEEKRPRAARVASAMPALPEMSRTVRLALVTLLVFAAIGLAYFLMNRGGTSEAHTVAVTAAEPSAAPLARDLLISLGTLPSVQTGSIQLLGESGDEGSDLSFETSIAGAGKTGANLVLLAGKDRAILWSKDFSQDAGTLADLKQQMAYTAGRVLGCAVEGLDPGGKPLRPQTLRSYLNGCSQLAETSYKTMPSVVPIFEQVVRDAPRFKAAWAKLLLAESNAVDNPDSPPRFRLGLQQHIEAARKVDPDMPEVTVAQVVLLPSKSFGEILRLLDQAKERNSYSSAVLSYRSLALSRVGRMNAAVEDAKEAARLDPTSPDALSNYVLSLAYAGRIDAARTELQHAERLWPGTGKLQDLQFAFQLRFGDPKEMLNSERFKESNPRMQLYYRTRADPTQANIDHFMAFLQGLYSRRGLTPGDIVGHSQAYGEFGREDNLYELIFRLPADTDLSQVSEVIFRPSLRKFRHDPRFMIVAKRIGLVDYWTKSGNWPDFCFDPDQPYDCKAEAAKLS